MSGETLNAAAPGSPRRGGSLRGAGPLRRGDAPAGPGVTGVPTTQDGGADTMRPGRYAAPPGAATSTASPTPCSCACRR
ncbi:hypothetical protein PUR29_27665 [Methylobacterium ajmalii]|uniref:Uncharacterized protein n=1 Tax=Methylobacterium ajmalii TaxID=2738439 RepID=A0ABV0A1G2_9HYPH